MSPPGPSLSTARRSPEPPQESPFGGRQWQWAGGRRQLPEPSLSQTPLAGALVTVHLVGCFRVLSHNVTSETVGQYFFPLL